MNTSSSSSFSLFFSLCSARVGGILFPEPIKEESEVASTCSTQVVPNQPTNLQRLAEPSQVVKNAIANLINYQVTQYSCMGSAQCEHLLQSNNDPVITVVR